MKNILITDGAGFFGSHLTENFLKKGYSIRVLDDFSNSSIDNIRESYNHSNFDLIQGDIRDKDFINKSIIDIDVIIHLAAQIHLDRSIIDPEYTFEVNTVGTANILRAAIENKVELVIYASSSEVYGTAQYIPMDEAHPLNPASPYGASKAAADRLCFAY